MEQIKTDSKKLIIELIENTRLSSGDTVVVGCSTSEIAGKKIGTGGSIKIAEAVFGGIYPELLSRGINLVAQCCEHLNRALTVERELALKISAPIVSAVPMPQAGGAFAHVSYKQLKNPVLIESISAKAGIDIGGTLIGMHLLPVAVPVRLPIVKLGEANVICAYSRPKYIGGERTVYSLDYRLKEQ